MTPSAFFVRAFLAAGLAVLSACSSVPVISPSDSLDQLEARLSAQGRQLDWLAEAQRLHREALEQNQQEQAARLRELIRSEMPSQDHCLALRPPQVDEPEPSCPGDDSPSIDALDKQILGEVEHILLTPPERIYRARVDTGAKTSSLDARSVEVFERDGDDWVRFDVPTGKDELETLERDVTRYVLISRSGTEEQERRPVVELQITLGETERMAEFTLTNRSHLDYPVLIGRNILRDLMVVDVSRKFAVPLPDEGQPVVERKPDDDDDEDDGADEADERDEGEDAADDEREQ